MQKVTINPHDSKEVELTINSYNLPPETANDIREYTKKVQSGEINSLGISLYVPSIYQGGISTFSTRTYVGYNNKTYYEDIVVYNSISSETQIKKTTKEKWNDYLKSTLTAIAKYYVDKGLDYVTQGAWSVASILTAGIPAQVSNQTEITHTAKLIQSIAKKNTYVVLDNQYYFGCRSENGTTYFQNFTNVPGYGQLNNASTPLKTVKLPNYDKGDEKAWFNYVNGGFVEHFDNYSYGGVVFPAI
ncbi:hypothetical protein J41TS12_30840 [Paenibacillus antibioticophila]|uniref:Uncharacterized protein n=1 Tax=Paenibacillus antibioticophila TaxID=1274374 RepID=A0A919XXB9_9BACL|nr:hypothetical protein J41TS12_30840 [Paenibacillus antibioticophila]